jgi:hypothetical protein
MLLGYVEDIRPYLSQADFFALSSSRRPPTVFAGGHEEFFGLRVYFVVCENGRSVTTTHRSGDESTAIWCGRVKNGSAPPPPRNRSN